MMGKEKPIWRLAFFSRLEERKGIKLFVDAVSALNVTDEKFEVHFQHLALASCSNSGSPDDEQKAFWQLSRGQ